MRVAADIDIAAAAPAVWAFVSDPVRTLHFMADVTRWELASEHDRGLGARYRTLMRVRSAEIGGLVEVVEYDEPRDLAWTSVTG
ncbi:MAG: SRPBCC family protein, partial [Solirubrobacterales bacterium]|nr:SRPBCC family protein [Solirubrobacterales bacterium]